MITVLASPSHTRSSSSLISAASNLHLTLINKIKRLDKPNYKQLVLDRLKNQSRLLNKTKSKHTDYFYEHYSTSCVAGELVSGNSGRKVNAHSSQMLLQIESKPAYSSTTTTNSTLAKYKPAASDIFKLRTGKRTRNSAGIRPKNSMSLVSTKLGELNRNADYLMKSNQLKTNNSNNNKKKNLKLSSRKMSKFSSVANAASANFSFLKRQKAKIDLTLCKYSSNQLYLVPENTENEGFSETSCLTCNFKYRNACSTFCEECKMSNNESFISTSSKKSSYLVSSCSNLTSVVDSTTNFLSSTPIVSKDSADKYKLERKIKKRTKRKNSTGFKMFQKYLITNESGYELNGKKCKYNEDEIRQQAPKRKLKLPRTSSLNASSKYKQDLVKIRAKFSHDNNNNLNTFLPASANDNFNNFGDLLVWYV